MLVQRFEPQGRRFTNFHDYYCCCCCCCYHCSGGSCGWLACWEGVGTYTKSLALRDAKIVDIKVAAVLSSWLFQPF